MLKEWRENYVHKYDSPFTCWLDAMVDADEDAGDVEAPTGWFGRYGRSIVVHDSQGFVSRERYPSVQAARDAFAELEAEYGEWASDDEDDD